MLKIDVYFLSLLNSQLLIVYFVNIMDLPLDIIKTIIAFCNLKTFYKLMQTCKTMYKICKPMVMRRMDNYALEHNDLLPNGNWHFTRRYEAYSITYINGYGIRINHNLSGVIHRCNYFNNDLIGVEEILSNNKVILRNRYRYGKIIYRYPSQIARYGILSFHGNKLYFSCLAIFSYYIILLL